ncbi:hypothetical protein [Bacillus piscicola]|uniref:hypothetical protein n=1 Tax=Bacillus piscicola TaxID=1632684 RepID=UPI001F09FAD6|nr:hypothetical protein [Bacillus piscicola]
MLKAWRERIYAKRSEWSREKQQCPEEYAGMNKDEEMLHLEVEKYLYTIHPSFLLNPDVTRALHNWLLAYSQGRSIISLHVSSEMRIAFDFYKTDLSEFIRLLEKKGFTFTGNEERFLMVLLNKLSDKNYHRYLARYGDFVQEIRSLEKAVFRYLEVVDDRNRLESGRIDFLHNYLIHRGLLPSSYTTKKTKKLVKSLNKMYADDYNVIRLEKSMHEIS